MILHGKWQSILGVFTRQTAVNNIQQSNPVTFLRTFRHHTDRLRMDHFLPPHIIQGYSFRSANKTDLDDLTRIHFIGFVEEPMDNYCYPFRAKYLDDHLKWMREEYEYYLDNSQKYLVHVAEAPEKPERGVNRKSIALAVWNIAVLATAPALGKLTSLSYFSLANL